MSKVAECISWTLLDKQYDFLCSLPNKVFLSKEDEELLEGLINLLEALKNEHDGVEWW